MRKIIENKIGGAKGVNYRIDNKVTSWQLFIIAFNRFLMLFRGFFKKILFKKSGRRIFIGRRVKIKFGKKIRLGNTVTINDDCFINGLCSKGVIIGNNVTIGKNSIVDCLGTLSQIGESLIIGDNVGISPNLMMFVRGPISIGDDVIIGPNVTFVSENHCFQNIDMPIRLQGVNRRGIKVENNCWIGANVTILDGVTIGENSIIAAGAVVNKSIEPNTIVGGVPAKTIKVR